MVGFFLAWWSSATDAVVWVGCRRAPLVASLVAVGAGCRLGGSATGAGCWCYWTAVGFLVVLVVACVRRGKVMGFCGNY